MMNPGTHLQRECMKRVPDAPPELRLFAWKMIWAIRLKCEDQHITEPPPEDWLPTQFDLDLARQIKKRQDGFARYMKERGLSYPGSSDDSVDI